MFYYAILDGSNVCVEILCENEEWTDHDNTVIEIPFYDTSLLGKVYNFDTQQFEGTSEATNCMWDTEQIAHGDRRLDLFIGNVDGLSLGENTPNNLVAAINQVFQFASDGKTAIANAITGKDDGLTIPENPTFEQLASLIGQISSGGLQIATGTLQEFTTPSSISGETPFQPKLVVIYNFGSGITNVNIGLYVSSELIGTQISDSVYGLGGSLSRYTYPFTITNTGFTFSNHGAATNLKWLALG